MKATIVRPDGTRIEVEGTPEEIAKLSPAPVQFPPSGVVCSCYTTWPCPLHAIRWPGIFYGPVGTIHAGAAVPLHVPALRPSAAAASSC